MDWKLRESLHGGDGSEHLEDVAAEGKQRALQKLVLWYLKRWWLGT